MSERTLIPIIFDEEMLTAIVSGGQVTVNHDEFSVAIILSDIGWDKIAAAFEKGKASKERIDVERSER
jgi:hypothetical protein